MALGDAHKAFLIFAVLGGLAMIGGSAAPHWLPLDLVGNFGLWYTCSEDGSCETYQWGDYLSDAGDLLVWFLVVHIAAGLATLFALVAVFTSLANLCNDKSSSTTGAGCVSILTGLLGIVTLAVFYVKKTESILSVTSNVDPDSGVAFKVFSAGSGILTLVGIVLVALRKAPTNAVGPV